MKGKPRPRMQLSCPPAQSGERRKAPARDAQGRLQHSRAKERKPRPGMRQSRLPAQSGERKKAPARDAAKPPPSTVGRKKSQRNSERERVRSQRADYSRLCAHGSGRGPRPSSPATGRRRRTARAFSRCSVTLSDWRSCSVPSLVVRPRRAALRPPTLQCLQQREERTASPDHGKEFPCLGSRACGPHSRQRPFPHEGLPRSRF